MNTIPSRQIALYLYRLEAIINSEALRITALEQDIFNEVPRRLNKDAEEIKSIADMLYEAKVNISLGVSPGADNDKASGLSRAAAKSR